MDRKFKDRDWPIENENGSTDWGKVPIAVLMDIRDELKKMNATLSVLNCSNFIAIPEILRKVSRNTTKPKVKP